MCVDMSCVKSKFNHCGHRFPFIKCVQKQCSGQLNAKNSTLITLYAYSRILTIFIFATKVTNTTFRTNTNVPLYI